MDVTVAKYLLFIGAALILIWAVTVLNKRLLSRDKPGIGSWKNWVELDVRHPQGREELLPEPIFDDDDEEVIELHVRAHQNGHHTENQPPLL